MQSFLHAIRAIFGVFLDASTFVRLCFTPAATVAAENLFLRKIRTRRLFHFNVTRHPTADWTLQQFRECVTDDEGYRFVIHDRDSIYSKELDTSLKALGLTVLKTPYKSPQANSYCERLIGTARHDCLDFMIPLNEEHIRQTLKFGGNITIKMSTFPSRTGNAGSDFPEGRASITSALHSEGLPNRSDIHSWWSLSRILL
jgi:hypothetical protein